MSCQIFLDTVRRESRYSRAPWTAHFCDKLGGEVPMTRLVFICFAALTLLGADDPWLKVQALPNRSELRIYKKDAREPLTVILADANEERIVVVDKKTQLTIHKEDIDRIDARPVTPPGQKPAVTSTEKREDPDYTPRSGPSTGPALPTTSSSSNMSFGGNKPDFRTVYLRPPTPAKK
jgi:hypothetical protein